MLLEEEGAVLNGNTLGLHKQQGYQNGLHNHTACKEEEGAPLHRTPLTVREQLKLTAWDPTRFLSAGLITSAWLRPMQITNLSPPDFSIVMPADFNPSYETK